MNLNRVARTDDRIPLGNALISVADKTGLAEFIPDLWEAVPNLEIYSSGGTFRRIESIAQKIDRTEQVHEVSEYTGQPEMQGGLVKTLDYRIYLGLLSERYNESHQSDITRLGAMTFDLTICNFYPFEAAAAEANATIEDLRTHIDIGGPTMLRASAKNFLRVTALSDPEDYPVLVQELTDHDGGTTLSFRAAMAAKAFRYTAHYENAIAGALGSYIANATAWDHIYDLSRGDGAR